MKLVVRADEPALRVKVPLEGSRTERGLRSALARLLEVTRKLPAPLGADEPLAVLTVTFHTPERRWVSERRFFERCARHPALAPLVLDYVGHVNPRNWAKDPFRGAGFWTSMMAPAGSLAIVPLALRDRRHLGALGEHLRGADLGHETFHRALITELVTRHGVCDEVLDLLAVRAVDAAGQHGCDDLRWLLAKTPVGAALATARALDAFAARVDRLSRRTAQEYRALYVSNAGQALAGGDASRFARWLAFFEGRGLAFDASEKVLESAREPWAPRAFEADWEEAASCDEFD